MTIPTLLNKLPKKSLYLCECGNEFYANDYKIKSGHTKSCGCYKISKLINRSSTHKLSNHRLYSIWGNMKTRCNNDNFMQSKDYKNRGIDICSEWQNNFMNFYNWAISNGYDDNLSIDRINNDVGYYPNNCRWSNHTVQARNTRLLKINNTSGYRGVTFKKSLNKYSSRISVNNKRIHIGYFNTPKEAGMAYNDYILSNNLEHTLNII